MTKIELPDHPELASQVIQSNLREAEMGYIGRLFGSREHAPTNIAGIIIIVGAIALLALAFLPVPDPSIRSDLVKVFGGILFAALGYLFGSIGGTRS